MIYVKYWINSDNNFTVTVIFFHFTLIRFFKKKKDLVQLHGSICGISDVKVMVERFIKLYSHCSAHSKCSEIAKSRVVFCSCSPSLCRLMSHPDSTLGLQTTLSSLILPALYLQRKYHFPPSLILTNALAWRTEHAQMPWWWMLSNYI